MRTIRFVILLAAAVTSFYTAGTAQAGSFASGKGNVADKPNSPPPAKKYFVEVLPLPSFCLDAETDRSDHSAIVRLRSQQTAPACPATSSPPQPSKCPPPPTVPSRPHCTLRFPATNAAAIADPKALGSDADYELDAIASDKIAIYQKAGKNPASSRLDTIRRAIDQLASPGFQYAEVVRLPTGVSKEIASQVSSLNSAGITADPLNGDRGDLILLKSNFIPDPLLLADLKRRIFDLAWQVPVAAPTQPLFHLDASTVVKSLSGSADASGDKSGSQKNVTDKSTADKTSGDKSAPENSASSTASPTLSVTVTAAGTQQQTKGSSDGPDSGALDSGSAKPSDSSKKQTDSAPKPLTMQAVNNTLIYSNADGTDRGIFERNRLMAVLDLPRPEVLLNVWSLQASSRDYRVTNAEANAVRGAVTQHNQLLQSAVDQGWDFLSQKMKEDAFFNTDFYDYITQKFALGLPPAPGSLGKPTNPDFALLESKRSGWGWCAGDKYCLGFTHAFEPLRPTFTNILLAFIAAEKASEVAKDTIAKMQGEIVKESGQDPDALRKTCSQVASSDKEIDRGQINSLCSCVDKARKEAKLYKLAGGSDCEIEDRLDIVTQVEVYQPVSLRLHCFQEQADVSFKENADNLKNETTRIGLLRAAVADFLFNYKWASQYPHSFIPYDLSQSAQELNAELNPLILAFNRDVAAFTQALQTEMECKYRTIPKPGWFGGGGDETFLNDGMIAVRGISGVESIVDTVTQSFFNATNPPSLTDLVKSVADAEKNLPGVLKTNLSANEASVLLGALNSVQPAEAKIGRELKLDITPHALAGASSAELDVKLLSGETADPTRFTADKSAEDNLSRVAKHETTTKVRVESLKLFEVSAFSAMLQRPRSKFPLLPPLFEVPYFGAFIGYPMPGAKVYHRSTAIVSAVIVPTAADLAYGIDFSTDRVCEVAPEDYGVDLSSDSEHPVHYICHRATTPNDFSGLPLRNYHKAMVQCFASSSQTAYTGTLTLQQKINQRQKNQLDSIETSLMQKAQQELGKTCKDLTFGKVPPNE